MQHKLSLLFIALFITSGLHAQITLNSAGYTGARTGIDSLRVTDSASAFPALNAMADGTWDMSGVTDSVPFHFIYRVPASGYQFADSNTYSFGGFGYQGNVNANIAATGILEYGVDIQKAAYSLQSITFNSGDSFIIDAQDMLYTSPRKKVAFPATYNSLWTSNYSSDLKYHLYFLSAGYNDTPGTVRVYTAEKDSVIGWGRMRVKDASGSPSPYQDVLQVQTMIVHTDSFFLGNGLLPFSLLTFFQLTEGQKDTTYEQNYYRVQEVTPLAQVEFNDPAYTQPYKATTHVQRFDSISHVGVAGVEMSSQVGVFPNPVTNRSLTVQLPAGSAQWSYSLVDVSGRQVTAGSLHPAGNTTTITLPSSIPHGIYYLQINDNNDRVSITPIEIAESSL